MNVSSKDGILFNRKGILLFLIFLCLKGMPGVFKVLTSADIPNGGKNDITVVGSLGHDVEEVILIY